MTGYFAAVRMCVNQATVCLKLQSVPFFQQQEITNVAVFDAVPAHIEFIKRNHVFWKVVPDGVINAELTLNRFV